MLRLLTFILLALCLPSYTQAEYAFTDEALDVVIPCTEKDLDILEHCIKGIRKNGYPIRRIIVVSRNHLTDLADWFDEKLFPFSKWDVALHLCGEDETRAKIFFNSPKSRTGWYYQQLLKLYAPLVIPGISPNVLILDADTIFLNPVHFLNEHKAGLYNPGTEYNNPYFEHAKRLIPGFQRRFKYHSGICHHMVFQKCVLRDLFKVVEQEHQKPFWKAFCHCVDSRLLNRSGASEYEIYFNYAFTHSSRVRVRKLIWHNVRTLDQIDRLQGEGCHYISCHDWMRP